MTSTNSGFAQKINDQEFSYYFNQLKLLSEGETIIFNSEDKYKKANDISALSKQDWQKLFYDIVKDKQDFEDLKYNKDCVAELWKKIKEFYLSQKGILNIGAVRNELFDLGKFLLNYSYSKINGAFEISDNFLSQWKIAIKKFLTYMKIRMIINTVGNNCILI